MTKSEESRYSMRSETEGSKNATIRERITNFLALLSEEKEGLCIVP